MEGFHGTWISDLKQAEGMEKALSAMQFTDEQKDHFTNSKRLVQYKVEGDTVTVLEAEIESYTRYTYKLGETCQRKGLHGEDIQTTMEFKHGKLTGQDTVSHSKLISGSENIGINVELKDKDTLLQTVDINGCTANAVYVKQL